MRYKKIQNFAIEVLKPIIVRLKRIKKSNRARSLSCTLTKYDVFLL